MSKKTIEGILWSYLQECLAIHHGIDNREIKTIPEAQKMFSQQIKELILSEMPKESYNSKIAPIELSSQEASSFLSGRNEAISDMRKIVEGL